MTIKYQQPINRQSPFNRGLMARWKVMPLWRGASEWRDLTGVYPVALSNISPTADWLGNSWSSGYGSLEFNGTSSYAGTTPTPFILPNECTVSLWANLDQATNYRPLFSVCDTKATSQLIWYVFTGGNMRVWWGSNGSFTHITSTGTVTTGTWQHYTLVRTGSGSSHTIRYYIDGVDIGGGTNATEAPGSGPEAVYIGHAPDWFASAWTDGKLDDAAVWGRAMSPSEVLRYYRELVAGSPTTINYVRRPRLFVPDAAGGPNIPAIASRSNVILGASAA